MGKFLSYTYLSVSQVIMNNSGYDSTNIIESKLLILLYNILICTFIFSNNEFEDRYISQYSNNASNALLVNLLINREFNSWFSVPVIRNISHNVLQCATLSS
jgi:hypothetical protein